MPHEIFKARHRHRYEFNTRSIVRQWRNNGLVFSGVSPDNRLMKSIEYPKNKFFVAHDITPNSNRGQTSRRRLFKAFIQAAGDFKAIAGFIDFIKAVLRYHYFGTAFYGE